MFHTTMENVSIANKKIPPKKSFQIFIKIQTRQTEHNADI